MSAFKIENIIFYFPYKGNGGVSIVFINFAKLLVNRFNVFIVDFDDGTMKRNLVPNVNFIDFENVIKYPPNSLIIFQSVAIWRIKDFYKFDEASRFLFWNLHPDNFFPYIYDYQRNNRFIGKHILLKLFFSLQKYYRNKILLNLKYLIKCNSLTFMDFENFRQTQESFPEVFLPESYMPCFIEKVNYKTANGNKEIKNFFWIGRIVKFKVHILIHLIKRLNESLDHNLDFNFKLTVIGGGDEMDFLNKQVSIINPKFTIEFMGDIEYQEINNLVLNNCDLLFAMGISALEGARIGIPTVLTDFSNTPILGNYKFRFLYEQSSFNLGLKINNNSFEEVSSFEKIINSAVKNFEFEGNKCLEYFLKNHSGELTLNIFLELIKNVKSTKREIEKLKLNSPDLFSFLYFNFFTFFFKNKIKILHGFRYPSN
jgi:hypothetical protein